MTFQIADVDKALGSVRQMVNNGNRVVFDTDAAGKDISYVTNKRTQERMPLRVENGVYVMDLVFGPPKARKESGTKSAGFTWQG